MLKTGPTREYKTLDLIYTNFPSQIVESGTILPLESDLGGNASDHKVVFCTAELKRYEAYEWVTYPYIKQTEEGNVKFKNWIISQDCSSVFREKTSNKKAECYQELVNYAMQKCFPTVTVKKKSTDDPWITDKIRKKIKQRKKIFKKQGRSKAWKKLKKKYY